MTRASRNLLDVLCDPHRADGLDVVGWDRLLCVARNAKVLPRLAYLIETACNSGEIPHRARDYLLAGQHRAEHHRRTVRWEVRCIRRALASLHVKTVLLKGAAYILAGLPAARGRLVSDVDVLVPKGRLGDVERALLAGGWEPMKLDPYDQRYYRTWMHELPPLKHRTRRTVLDVHHTILPESGRLHPDPAKLLAAARPIESTGLFMLAPDDMVLHSAAHLFQDGDLAGGLRDLIDLDDLLRHFGRTEPQFWQQLVRRAERVDLCRPLYYALRFTHMLLGTPVPQAALAAAARWRPQWPVSTLMDRLVRRALVPPTTLKASDRADRAQFLLYIRSHWLRMPPLLLAQHLWRKIVRRWIGLTEQTQQK